MQVALEHAAAQLVEFVRAAQRGEDVVIVAPGGEVRLAPVAVVPGAPPRPVFGFARGTVSMADDFDAPLADFDDHAA